MSTPTSTNDTFWNSGGARAAKFTDAGTSVSGPIVFISDQEPPLKFGTTEIDTEAPLQVRVILQTTEHDSDDEDDDGRRCLYVRGNMKFAIGKAVKAAGGKVPELGGTLTVTHTGVGVPRKPGLNPPKLYEASYVMPQPGSTNGTPVAAAPDPLPSSAPPASGIDQKTWDNMPDDAKKAVSDALPPW
jgi:hypothetical protein